jgi:hypothetical protein
MRYLRSFTATLLSAAIAFRLVTASGCGTNAVGVDDCRDIEQARCHAGAPCGIIEDVGACDRYYRDHCLHGLAAKPPAGASVSACVQVIEAAGRCAQADPDAKLESCSEVVTASQHNLVTACEVVTHPELATECSFLLDMPPEDSGSAGQGAGGQSTDGTSGSAGQTGAAGAEAAPGGASAG